MTLPRLTLLAAALTQSVYGQESAPDNAVKVEKVEITAAADDYDARREDTASKIVVGHEEIVKYGDTSVLDVLKRLPGVTVSGASGRGGEIRMRGLGSGYTQILVNGERMPAGFSIDALAPDSVERIEIIRAATAEFSAQAIAGTINIVLKKTVRNAQRELKAGVAGARHVIGPNASLLLSDRVDGMSYSVTVNTFYSHFRREAPSIEQRTGADGQLVQDALSSFSEEGAISGLNIGPRLNWTFANGDTLASQSFVNLWRYNSGASAETITRIGDAPAYPFLAWDMHNRSLFARTDLNWVKKLDAGAKLDLKIGTSAGKLRVGSARAGYAGRSGQPLLDSDVATRGRDHGYSSTGKYASPLGGGHALALGWDGGVNKRADRRTEIAVAYDPDPGEEPENSDARYNGEVKRMAAYAQDEWNVTPRWSVYLGVRWEGIATDVSGDRFDAVSSRTSVWSPLLQTLYKLNESRGDQLRFALTRTYKAPSTQSLIPRIQKAANNNENEPDYIGNPALKPELAVGFDTAYERYWAQGAMVSISASARRISDYTHNEVRLVGARQVSRPINDGKASTRGLDFDAKFPLSCLFQNAPAIDLRANFSRNWSTVDAVAGPDNRVEQQTRFSSTLGADYKAGALTAGASYSFRSGGPVRISQEQSSYQSVRRDLDMYALWKIAAKNQLRVVLSNVLEQDYISEAAYVNRETGVMSMRRAITPGNATLRVSMEMTF
jgi:outer membrane receptor for ferrienterochelin and colicins